MDASGIGSDDVIYFLAASIDGYIADAKGDDGFLHPYFIPQLNFHDFFARIGTTILGRRTWNKVESSGKWPYGAIPGIVATHHPVADIGAPVQTATGSPTEILAAARNTGPGAYWLVGGSDLATQFLAAGLITRIEMFTMPVLAGGGTPAFRATPQLKMQRVATNAYANGVTHATWRRA